MDKIERLVKHAEVSEKVIERYLCTRVKKLGGVCLKYSNAGAVGYPDRVALMPQGGCVWFEIKSKDGRLSKAQQVRINQMANIGHTVYVVSDKESIDNIFKALGYYAV